MADQSKAPLLEALKTYSKKDIAYFCVPGHRKERGIDPEFAMLAKDGIFGIDLTETPLTDDLHAPSGPIKEAEALAAELWGSDHARFLVNGSTCGNIAMIMSAALVGLNGLPACNGQTIAIARNSHRSALSGLILSGAAPIYLQPDILRSFNSTGCNIPNFGIPGKTDPNFSIPGGIDPGKVEELFKAHPECKGLLITSPTYYGICSDLKSIADICHRHGALLMVDEAHGAHLHVSEDLPADALSCGADMCVQSTHKTCGSLTQSSILHVKDGLADIDSVDSALRMIQSSSPSYILMASLDAARRDLAKNGSAQAARAVRLAEDARTAINKIPGLSCLDKSAIGKASIFDLDLSRLVVNVSGAGLRGHDVRKTLFDKYEIDTEMADENNIVAVITWANTEEEIGRLTAALKEIALNAQEAYNEQKIAFSPVEACISPTIKSNLMADHSTPTIALSPREAYFAPKERISWEDASGRISAETIAPYPPGIPLVCPGELITDDLWKSINDLKKHDTHIQGPSDPALNTLLVIKP